MLNNAAIVEPSFLEIALPGKHNVGYDDISPVGNDAASSALLDGLDLFSTTPIRKVGYRTRDFYISFLSILYQFSGNRFLKIITGNQKYAYLGRL